MRGNIYISMVFNGVIDSTTGKEQTEVFFTNQTDINGLVPKMLVNAISRQVPKFWFKKYEAGC